jgi:hypothetical protein
VGLKNKLFFGFFITALLRGYLKFTLSFMQDTTNPSEEALSFSSLMIPIFAWLPFFIFAFLRLNRHRLNHEKDPAFLQTYGALYSTLKPSQYPFPSVFLLRRFLLALTPLFTSSSHAHVNLLLQMTMSMMMLSYLLSWRPCDIPRDNLLEVFNEGTVLGCMWLSAGLGGGIGGVDRGKLGEAMIGLIVINITVNMLVFLHGMYTQVRPKVIKVLAYIRSSRRKARKHVLIPAS